MLINKKFVFSLLAIVLATLACGLPTSNPTSAPPNQEATQLAATIVALQSNQNAPVSAPTNEVAPPANTAVPVVATATVPAATALPTKPMLSVTVATNCRSGPGIKYPITGSILIGDSYEVTARGPSTHPYVIIRNPGGGADCWAWLEFATITGDTNPLPILAAPPAPLGSISGILWVEDCDDLNPANTGCVNGPGLPEGDGSFNNEMLLADVTVELFSGKCPSSTSLAKVKTTTNGYKFDSLEAGTYCVVVETFKFGNDSFLIVSNFGGMFTSPSRGNDVQSFEVSLLPGKHISGFKFGWDDFEQ